MLSSLQLPSWQVVLTSLTLLSGQNNAAKPDKAAKSESGILSDNAGRPDKALKPDTNAKMQCNARHKDMASKLNSSIVSLLLSARFLLAMLQLTNLRSVAIV